MFAGETETGLKQTKFSPEKCNFSVRMFRRLVINESNIYFSKTITHNLCSCSIHSDSAADLQKAPFRQNLIWSGLSIHRMEVLRFVCGCGDHRECYHITYSGEAEAEKHNLTSHCVGQSDNEEETSKSFSSMLQRSFP